jgi:hypothetical protein
MCCSFFTWTAAALSIAGSTDHLESCWMEQMARNATLEGWGFLHSRRCLFDDGMRSSVSLSETPISESFTASSLI